MRCSQCYTTLTRRTKKNNAHQTQIMRSYACPGCGATVETQETVVNVRRVDTGRRTDVPVRSAPKRRQTLDDLKSDIPSDFADLPPVYKGE